jgi:hypothetical protein
MSLTGHRESDDLKAQRLDADSYILKMPRIESKTGSESFLRCWALNQVLGYETLRCTGVPAMNLKHLVPLLLCIVALCIPTYGEQSPSDAKQIDAVISRLEGFRISYEELLEKAYDRIIGRMGEKDENREAFKRNGSLPDELLASSYYKTYMTKRAQLVREYEKAAAGLDEVRAPELAETIRSESTSFQNQRDLLPWSDNCVGKEVASILEPGSTPIRIVSEIGDDYRLRIRAVGKKGDILVITMPIANGKTLDLLASADERGRFSVLVSVSAGSISADVGLRRPIDATLATESDGKGITIRCESGKVKVEVIQTKVIVAEPPQDVAENKQARESKPEPAKAPTQDPWWAGRKWHGQEGPRGATATIVRREGRIAVIRINRKDGAIMEVAGNTSGNRIAVYRVDQVCGPRGVPPPNVREPGGSGGITQNGRLLVSYSYRWSTTKVSKVGTFNFQSE